MNEVIVDRNDIETKLTALAERSMHLLVVDDTSLLIADSIQTECRKMRQFIEEKYKKIKRPIQDSLDNVRSMEKEDLARVVPLEEHLKSERTRYQLEQKKKREAEEKRLREEAEAREEAERVAAAAEQEKEAARLRKEAEEEAARAEKLANEGKVEEAVALLDQSAAKASESVAVQQEAEKTFSTPAYVPPPRMAPAPKTKNALKMIVDRERLQTITDMLTKGTTKTPPQIPGVRFYQKWEYEVFDATAVPETYRRPA